MVGTLEGLALSEHSGLEARPGRRCNSAEPAQGDLALTQLREAPLQMQGSGRDREDRAWRARHAASCTLLS